MAKRDNSGIPACKACKTAMAPKRTMVISGSGQRPRMLQVDYECPDCKAKSAIEREEYDLLAAEDSVWKKKH